MAWIILLSFVSIIAWGAWWYIVVSIDPAASGFIGPLLFYASFALALASSVTAATFGLRRKLDSDEIPWRHIRSSLREGVGISLFMAFSLYLAAGGMLRWWNGILLAIIAFSLEGIFLMKEHARRARRVSSLHNNDRTYAFDQVRPASPDLQRGEGKR
ncbi:MAG: hypothetical protein AAB444_02525 [Patescibacteria group bacterium]